MKIIFAFALLFASMAAFAESDRYYQRNDTFEREAIANARRNNQGRVDELIRREVDRRHRSSSSCGQSYWTKKEARQKCAPGTLMKVRENGDTYYTCDC